MKVLSLKKGDTIQSLDMLDRLELSMSLFHNSDLHLSLGQHGVAKINVDSIRRKVEYAYKDTVYIVTGICSGYYKDEERGDYWAGVLLEIEVDYESVQTTVKILDLY